LARKGSKDRGLFEKEPGSNVWWICYADAQGKKRREKAGLKRVAQALYTRRKREAREGVVLPERKKKLTFGEIAQEALDYSKAHNTSWRDDWSRGKDLIEAFGDRPADSITHREIQTWLLRFKDERQLAPATINNYRALFSRIFSYAIEGDRLNNNPVRNTKKIPVENERIRQLSKEEYAALMAVLTPQQQIEVEFALHTGGRRWNQFDLKWTDIEDGVAFFAKTKNRRPQYIHLNSLLRGLLAQVERKGEYVFQDSHDEILRNNKLNWWYKALDAAKIQNFRWHDLRHTFASRLAERGHSLRTIGEALNHKSPQMTQRYAHLTETHMKDALEGLV
jgi:integrase